MHTLKIRHETALPIREISALTTRRGASGDLELLAVGDEDFAVIKASFDNQGVPAGTWRYDLFLPLVGTGIDLRGGSGFEGVAADGAGTVFVLQEEESRILVFDAELTSLRHIISLDVPDDGSELATAWNTGDANARAEGLLLLDGGHVVVAKQKEPTYLIEFGAPADDAVGVSADTALDDRTAFPLGAGDRSRLVPVAVWKLHGANGKALTTLNDIACGPDGHVYLLSSKAQLIGRLEKTLKPRVSEADVTELWNFDGGEDTKPEGLALSTEFMPIVGFDSKLAGSNLLILDPRPDAGRRDSSHAG